MTTQLKANLRVCAWCEYIYKYDITNGVCPACGMCGYGARFVYGDKCYSYQYTQEPWIKRKIDYYESKLRDKLYRMSNK